MEWNTLVMTIISSRVMKKPDFHTCENIGTDQLCGNHDIDITLLLLHIYELSSCGRTARFVYCVGPGRKPRIQVSSRRGSYGTD